MTLGNDWTVIDKRRRHVAALKLRGLTVREIGDALPGLGSMNPDTGKPWSYQTVQNDLEAIRADWRREAREDFHVVQSQILAELRELRRAAWTEKNFKTVVAALDRECKILGMDAPLKIENTGDGTFKLKLDELSNEQLAAVLALFAAPAAAGAEAVPAAATEPDGSVAGESGEAAGEPAAV